MIGEVWKETLTKTLNAMFHLIPATSYRSCEKSPLLPEMPVNGETNIRAVLKMQGNVAVVADVAMSHTLAFSPVRPPSDDTKLNPHRSAFRQQILLSGKSSNMLAQKESGYFI